MTKFGRVVFCCLWSNSQIEGAHNHLRRVTDSCAKHAGPRVHHYRLKDTGFRWNVRALVKAGIIPRIEHYDTHLRDRLCDVVRGTPHVVMAVLEGWQRVDQSINPTVPRGVVEGFFDGKLLDRERRQGLSERPHSKQLAEDWAGDTWGHKAPVNLTKRGDIQKALKVPEVMVLQGSKATENDVFRVYSATGLLVPKGDLGKFASQTEKRQHLTVALQHQNHTQLAQ